MLGFFRVVGCVCLLLYTTVSALGAIDHGQSKRRQCFLHLSSLLSPVSPLETALLRQEKVDTDRTGDDCPLISTYPDARKTETTSFLIQLPQRCQRAPPSLPPPLARIIPPLRLSPFS